MEITTNLHPRDWYKNTIDNDLNYWGLDYPPLSAYVSYIIGRVIAIFEPETIMLHSSRGYETSTSRVLMRTSVILADVLIFFPALLLLVQKLCNTTIKKGEERAIATFRTIAFCVTLPSLLLIDHTHFQYNNISIGLFLLSLFCFGSDRHGLGAILFCSSIFFKQLSLYYVLAIYAFLYTNLFQKLMLEKTQKVVGYVTKIMFAIVASILCTFAPWISSKNDVLTVLKRLFPVGRGLYEDKVANVWCSISIFIKLHRILGNESLFVICTITTVMASLPFAFAIARNPNLKKLLLCSSGVSLATFLFSYQVHEKQVVLPLMPLAALHHEYPLVSIWMSLTAAFSVFPLLLREKSVLAYVVTIFLHLLLYQMLNCNPESRFWDMKRSNLLRIFSIGLGATAIFINCLQIFLDPPSQLPDVFTMMNSIFACANLCCVYFMLLLLSFS